MRYEVQVTRDEDAWMVDVPQVQRVTEALSLKEVDVMARDLIHIMTGEEPEAITLDVHVLLPDAVQESIDTARHQRELAESSARLAVAESRQAAKQLHGMGVTLCDIGMTLGISYQRAHQLVNA
ncbi:hypothetical protein [Bifidobacterium tibiigranuli]|jgi:hypothetical protein|uniref:hypothetical protein n=1 Tax=Bifidobacterium tibiigranuli TaxID=2172043 RepID=UPI0026EC7D1D|nr:hypothetical protein [Bifidobacterium tibiigranuli]MCI1650260.1 hypothetical protein [Bifidobacterium tibiigranuli]MCI2184816.1 hypothetical protein [Bifidobacterium tibiigranuli]MCI2204393.1 hypothetical protein [Bifidobacterium tibiigranuli]